MKVRVVVEVDLDTTNFREALEWEDLTLSDVTAEVNISGFEFEGVVKEATLLEGK